MDRKTRSEPGWGRKQPMHQALPAGLPRQVGHRDRAPGLDIYLGQKVDS